ncbi:Tyrosine-protein phosphatase non-receptor type 23-like [Oopsacas minuta]|uniref:Tyrosine-protein phosphatase non-receptor type 23-like n=1 Tax=Oopsacas minuta TaxID=111878 RepID=A0AAV7K9R2_9METZ|nr:Tyrosine-protein phosphatase non-receptor type 23-like [Oopsacas minuta]
MSLTDSSTELSHGYMDQLRLPMLTIPSKQGVSIDLTSSLAELIRTEFGEDPTNFRQEVREFNHLRESAVRPSRDNNGTSDIRRYYAQLCLLPTRFSATRSNMQVTFIWSDAFTEKESANILLFSETSAILFNLGALHSRLGSDLPDELRSACTHFQCSAGAFYLLQTSLAFQIATANNQVDMSSEVVAFCKNLMLAQAQECMVEKSLLERKRPSLVSKVAWEVSALYQKAIDLLDSQIGSQVAKKNKKLAEILTN